MTPSSGSDPLPVSTRSPKVPRRLGGGTWLLLLLAAIFGAPWVLQLVFSVALLGWFALLGATTVALVAFGAGAVLIFHLTRASRGIPSAPVALKGVVSPWWFVAGVPVLIAFGEAQLLGGSAPGLLFALTIIAGSALAETAVLAFLIQQTGAASTWRRVTLCAAAGATLSVAAVLTIGGVVPLTVVALAAALRDLGAQLLRDLAFTEGTQDIARLFFSDRGLFAVATVAIAAPIVEEALKPLGVVILGRRVGSPREAFLLGAACGAGFAVLENIMYESVVHPVWGGIVVIRSIGAALHPLGAGLVALGWYGVFHGHPRAWARLGGLYLVAVTQHWLWNMASVATYLATGSQVLSGGFTLDVLGISIAVVLAVFFAAQGVAMLAAMRYVGRRVAGVPASEPVPSLVPVILSSPRGVALAATASLIVLLPLGAAAIQAFLIYLGQR